MTRNVTPKGEGARIRSSRHGVSEAFLKARMGSYVHEDRVMAGIIIIIYSFFFLPVVGFKMDEHSDKTKINGRTDGQGRKMWNAKPNDANDVTFARALAMR